MRKFSERARDNNNNFFPFSVRAQSRLRASCILESCKRLETQSSLLDCLAVLLVSYTLGLIVDRGIARARTSLLRA